MPRSRQLLTWCRVVGCAVMVVVMLHMFVLKHDLMNESPQPDARVGSYQMHQREPN